MKRKRFQSQPSSAPSQMDQTYDFCFYTGKLVRISGDEVEFPLGKQDVVRTTRNGKASEDQFHHARHLEIHHDIYQLTLTLKPEVEHALEALGEQFGEMKKFVAERQLERFRARVGSEIQRDMQGTLHRKAEIALHDRDAVSYDEAHAAEMVQSLSDFSGKHNRFILAVPRHFMAKELRETAFGDDTHGHLYTLNSFGSLNSTVNLLGNALIQSREKIYDDALVWTRAYADILEYSGADIEKFLLPTQHLSLFGDDDVLDGGKKLRPDWDVVKELPNSPFNTMERLGKRVGLYTAMVSGMVSSEAGLPQKTAGHFTPETSKVAPLPSAYSEASGLRKIVKQPGKKSFVEQAANRGSANQEIY